LTALTWTVERLRYSLDPAESWASPSTVVEIDEASVTPSVSLEPGPPESGYRRHRSMFPKLAQPDGIISSYMLT
jgi:hypothetical protein